MENYEKYTSKTCGFWFIFLILFILGFSIYRINSYFIEGEYKIFGYSKNLFYRPYDEKISIKKEYFDMAIKKIFNSNYSDFFYMN